MIVSPETLALIKASRKNTITVPNANYKVGKAYALQTSHATPAQAHITILALKESPGKAAVTLRFVLGDHTDTDRYLAAQPGGPGGDYTFIPARRLTGTGAEVSAEELSRYALMAHESHENGLQERRERLLRAIGQIRLEMARQGLGSPLARKRLKTVEHELRRIQSPRRVA